MAAPPASLRFIRHGVGVVRPYLFGHLDLPAFVARVFDAEELVRLPVGKGFHVEAKIGDSVIMMEVGTLPSRVGPAAAVYVFVRDVDAVYRRAIQAGGTSVNAPEDKPCDERNAGVKDTFGNTWWIATCRQPAVVARLPHDGVKATRKVAKPGTSRKQLA